MKNVGHRFLKNIITRHNSKKKEITTINIVQAQALNCLMAYGIKLPLSVVGLILMLRYRLPDGSKKKGLLLG